MQPQRHLLRIALGIQRQQPSVHIVADGIRPAVTPAEFAAAAAGAGGLQLALEIEGVAGVPEEQLATLL